MASYLIAVHPDDSERVYPFGTPEDAERAKAAMEATDWTPDPKCPCCRIKVATVQGVMIKQTDIEELYVR